MKLEPTTITVYRAKRLLGLASSRQVRNLLATGVLTGRKLNGYWRLDVYPVEQLAREKRARLAGLLGDNRKRGR